MTTGARDFARALVAGHTLPSGEPALAHADGASGILESLGAPPEMVAAPYLAAAAERLAMVARVVAAQAVVARAEMPPS